MSATQVPLRPIAKGSLVKFWIAVIALVAVAFLIAKVSADPLRGITSDTGVNIRTLVEGEGDPMTAQDAALVEYRGELADNGEVFDENTGQPTPMIADGLIPGFAEALLQMRQGGEYRVFIPADQGYGSDVPPGGPIPPEADLVFNVKIVEIGRDLAPMIQAQRQQMMGGGIPPGAAPPPQPEGVPEQ